MPISIDLFYSSYFFAVKMIRCTHSNRDLSRQGAILLLDLLLMHFDHHHSAHPGGFINAADPVGKPVRPRQSPSAEPAAVPEDDEPSPRKEHRLKAVKASAGYHGECNIIQIHYLHLTW